MRRFSFAIRLFCDLHIQPAGVEASNRPKSARSSRANVGSSGKLVNQ